MAGPAQARMPTGDAQLDPASMVAVTVRKAPRPTVSLTPEMVKW